RVRVDAGGHEPAELESLAVEGRLVLVPAHLRARDGKLLIDAPSTEIQVDGHGTMEPALALSPGEHVVIATARGHVPELRTVEVSPDATTTVQLSLQPTAQRRVARFTLFGAAGLVAGAAVSGGRALIFQSVAVRPANTRD